MKERMRGKILKGGKIMAAIITPDKALDVRGIACSLVMMKTKQTLDGMEAGKVLEVITTDECTEYDIPAWVSRTGKELLTTSKDG